MKFILSLPEIQTVQTVPVGTLPYWLNKDAVFWIRIRRICYFLGPPGSFRIQAKTLRKNRIFAIVDFRRTCFLLKLKYTYII
jgi:hypothetical protein